MRIDRDVGCGVILRGAVSLAVSTSQVCLSHHSFLCQCLGFLVLQNFTILTVQAHLSFYFSCCDFMDVRITNNSFYLKASRHPSWWYVPRRENRINVSIGVKKKYNVWTTEIWLLKHGNPNSWKCHKSFIKQWMAKVATMWRYCVSLWRKTLPSRWASRSTTGTTTSKSCLLTTCSGTCGPALCWTSSWCKLSLDRSQWPSGAGPGSSMTTYSWYKILVQLVHSIEMDFSSELAWRGPHVCWPRLLHNWLRGQFCDFEVFKIFAKLHILRWVFLWPCSTGTSTWSPRRLAGSSTSSSPGVRKSESVLKCWYAGSSPSVVFSPPCSTGRACSTCWTASRSGSCQAS